MRCTLLAIACTLLCASPGFAQELGADAAHQKQATDLRGRGEYDLAMAEINQAIKLAPDSGGRASYLSDRSIIWRHTGEFDKAIADCDEALRLHEFGVARSHLGRAWFGKGDFAKAIANYNQAFFPDETAAHHSPSHPLNPLVFADRAAAYSKLDEYEKALTDFNEAIRLGPTDAYAYEKAAWFRATCPAQKYRDGERAVTNARKACELNQWKTFAPIDTLAAAYAEAGDFDSAIKWEQKAIDMNPRKFGEKHAAEKRLQLYKDRKPYRDEPAMNEKSEPLKDKATDK